VIKMKCKYCGREMESLNEWLSKPHVEGGMKLNKYAMTFSRVVDGKSETRFYDLLECPHCGRCIIKRLRR